MRLNSPWIVILKIPYLPIFIVPLGAIALSYYTGDKKISKRSRDYI